MKSQPAPDDLIDPITGEIVNSCNVDELVDALERNKKTSSEVYLFTQRIADILAALAPKSATGGKTVRVRGDRRRVKIELPGVGWDQRILRNAWESFPKFARQVLSIGQINVRSVEWKKVLSETGPADFENFKGLVASANKGPTGHPRIIIEE